MVVCPPDHSLQADVMFLIEGTAVNGAYISDIKSNYIIPALEYFSQGNLDESSYVTENANSVYGIVVYQAADCLPQLATDTYGPFSSPTKLLAAFDRLELIGGKAESHANVAEALARALMCFEELQTKRETNVTVHKHCILICNSPPYSLPVLECHVFANKTAEQLASIIQEKNINLSIISPRKIPSLYKLFEKAGGDLSACQNKHYAKDPRHLVLLKGFSLKERPISPPPGQGTAGTPQLQTPVPSLPSPLPGSDSPSTLPGTQQGGSGAYRPSVTPNLPKIPPGTGPIPGRISGHQIMPNPLQPAPPVYPGQRPSPHWQMPPPVQQPRPPYMQGPQGNPSQGGSALIAQLTQPPSSMPGGPGVNQFAPPNQTIQTSMASSPQTNQITTSQAQSTAPPAQQVPIRERHTIWQGLLEWIEKPNQQKITKQVPCQVSASTIEGEPELTAEGWPQKLIMQLMPKHLIGSIGGAYLKNSKSVLFHPQNCEALDSLTKVMNSGYAGCVHFTNSPNHSSCDIKVLILLYTADKRAYLGFIPNDQVAFVDRLRKVIQQQKTSHILRQSGTNGPPLTSQTGAPITMANTPPQMSSTGPSQTAPSGMMISQTNTLSLGGGQITQNVPPATGQQAQPIGGGLMQAGQGAMRPGMRGVQNPSNAPGQSPSMPMGMINAPVPRAPFENQLQVERQQNLEKINQLKQTLEAAQQQEQQYKSQLEQISQLKTSQIQQALHDAQQTEMQFKMLDQQRMANEANPQAANAQQQQQQRMMRPVMANNPGLRHLLQQQPQFRQQLINMQQIGPNGPRGQIGQQPNQRPNQQTAFDDVSNFDFNNII